MKQKIISDQRIVACKEIEFDYGHRIQDHKSKCKNLHGHRGKIKAYISGPLQKEGSSKGMVLDFSDIKEMLCVLHDRFDHGLILEYNDPFLNFINLPSRPPNFSEDLGLGKVHILTAPPTAENLAAYCFGYLRSRLAYLYPGSEIKLEKVKFYETPTSSATIKAVK